MAVSIFVPFKLAAVAMAIAATAHATAGVVYEIEVKDHEQSPPKTGALEAAVEGRHLKMPIPASDGSDSHDIVIFSPDRGPNGTLYLKTHDGPVISVDGSGAGYPGGGAAPKLTPDQQRMLEEILKRGGRSGVGSGDATSADGKPVLSEVQRRELDKILKAEGGGRKPPKGLSGGQRQRVAIARVIIHDPELILADEPFAEGFKVSEEGALTHIVWAKPKDRITGGDELAEAFQALGDFLKLSGVPPQIKRGLFIYDLAKFNGLVPIGVDEYFSGEEQRIRRSRRMKRNSVTQVGDHEFAVD